MIHKMKTVRMNHNVPTTAIATQPMTPQLAHEGREVANLEVAAEQLAELVDVQDREGTALLRPADHAPPVLALLSLPPASCTSARGSC